MTPIVIRVTQTDIDTGRQDNCHECPVALAALRAGVKAAEVDALNVSGIVGAEVVSLFMPLQARLFVEDFDAGEPVQPFEFTVPQRNE